MSDCEDALMCIDDPLDLYVKWRRDHPGRAVPLRLTTESGFRLGQWVARMRAARYAGTLPPERVQQLTDAGFTWSGAEDRAIGRRCRSQARWREMLSELDEYKHHCGDVVVPTRHITDRGNNLGTWLSRQQSAWRAGQLSADRQHDLYMRGVRATRDDTLQAAFDDSAVLATHHPARRCT